jgi:hypothetical protein
VRGACGVYPNLGATDVLPANLPSRSPSFYHFPRSIPVRELIEESHG